MKLRAESKHPEAAAKVRADHILQFGEAMAKIHQVQPLIAIGDRFLLTSVGGSRVLADRHPSFGHELISARLKRLKAAARREAWIEVAAVIGSRIIEVERQQAVEENIPQAKVEILKDLKKQIESEFGSIAGGVKTTAQFKFSRGADAAVADEKRPREDDLDGFRDD
jgi:hypothetical protein